MGAILRARFNFDARWAVKKWLFAFQSWIAGFNGTVELCSFVQNLVTGTESQRPVACKIWLDDEKPNDRMAAMQALRVIQV
jgi:hypothetical protein